jgi:hypothetical protein
MLPGDNYEETSRFPVAFIAGVAIVLLLGAGAALLVRRSRPTGIAAATKLPFGQTEMSYTPHVQFQGIQMAHSTNFLNQEFTFVAGTIVNNGDREIDGLQVTIEFHDQFNQTILRDSEIILAPTGLPLPAGQMRDFQVILERIPSDWNRQYPSIRVTGMILK